VVRREAGRPADWTPGRELDTRAEGLVAT
jgi:hypothetical protein